MCTHIIAGMNPHKAASRGGLGSSSDRDYLALQVGRVRVLEEVAVAVANAFYRKPDNSARFQRHLGC